MAQPSSVPVDICNLALTSLGQDPIRSLDENNKRARSCRAVYEVYKRELLRKALWKFATRTAVLAPIRDDALEKLGFVGFLVPRDFVRKKRVWFGDYRDDVDYDIDHSIQGRNIVVKARDVGDMPLRMLYISSEVTEDDFDDLFLETLAMRIAYGLTYSLVQSTSLRESLRTEYESKLGEARSVDSQEVNEFTNNSDTKWNDFADSRIVGVGIGGNDVVPAGTDFNFLPESSL